jgi:hypothetical protein
MPLESVPFSVPRDDTSRAGRGNRAKSDFQFHPGRAVRKNPFLRDAETGRDAVLVVWRAVSPRSTGFDSGFYLKEEDFHLLDAVGSEKLATEAEGRVLYCELRSLGVTHTGPYPH